MPLTKVVPIPDATESDKEKARRARKRVTDRKSQKHHRERQRAYIQELEETVQSYKQSCAQDGGANVTALLEENEKLRERCHILNNVVSKIQDLIGDTNILRRLGAEDKIRAPSSTQTPPASEQDSTLPKGMDNNFEDLMERSTAQSPLKDVSIPEPSCISAEPYTVPDFLEEFDNLITAADGTPPHASILQGPQATIAFSHFAHPAGAPGGLQAGDQVEEQDLGRCIDALMDGTAMSLDLIPMSLTMRDPLLTRLAARQISVANDNEPMTHMELPTTTQSSEPWDKILQRMIDEARVEHSLGRFPTAQPSLRSVLSRDISDILASRLYHYLGGYGTFPMHIFLSIFWVQYLYLRWLVLGTRAAYLQMPEFMRPTELERRIPHRLCIGMLVWPDIRRTLVRDSLSADPERTGIEMARYLGSTWSATAHVTGDLIGSPDVLAVLEQQATRMDTWKLEPTFCERNPAFAHCKVTS